MIDEADRDGDGEIGEEEFMRIMKKTNLFWESRRCKETARYDSLPRLVTDVV